MRVKYPAAKVAVVLAVVLATPLVWTALAWPEWTSGDAPPAAAQIQAQPPPPMLVRRIIVLPPSVGLEDFLTETLGTASVSELVTAGGTGQPSGEVGGASKPSQETAAPAPSSNDAETNQTASGADNETGGTDVDAVSRGS